MTVPQRNNVRLSGRGTRRSCSRYIDAEGYRGGFSRVDIEELLHSLDSNYLGWSSATAPAIMANPDRPKRGQELTNSFCRTDRRSPGISRESRFSPTIERTFRRSPSPRSSCSARTTSLRRRKAKAAGFDAHLVKPVDHDALSKLIADVESRT